MKILHLLNEWNKCLITQNILLLNEELNKRYNLYFEVICGKIINKSEAEYKDIKIIENGLFLKENRNMKNFFSALTFLRRHCKGNNINILHAHYDFGALLSLHTSYRVELKTIQSILEINDLSTKLSGMKTDRLVIFDPEIFKKVRPDKTFRSELIYIDQNSPKEEFIQNCYNLYIFK